MQRVINHVRRQPDHVRELWATGCTLVVVLAIAAFWFHSFEDNVYALLNPSDVPADNQSQFAVNPLSLFGFIGDAISSSKAQILNLFDHSSDSGTTTNSNPVISSQPSQPHPLPLTK